MLSLTMGCAQKTPTITNVRPDSGPSGGGTHITIAGSNFKKDSTVTIGGVALKDIKINTSGTNIEGTTPGGLPGIVDVIVKNPNAEQPSVAAKFTYEALEVVSTDPSDMTELSSPIDQVSVEFSQDIKVNSVIITIAGISGEVKYDPSTRVVIFKTQKPLKLGKSYMVRVSGAKDMADNIMADYTFGFKIESAVIARKKALKAGVKSGSVITEPNDFVGFMTDFYTAYKTGNWMIMTRLAESIEARNQFFQLLIEGSQGLAVPNMRDSSFDWSAGEFLSSGEIVLLGFCILAAGQGRSDPTDAEPTMDQRKSVLKVWKILYRTALSRIGSADEPTPTSACVTESKEKLSIAMGISMLLKDSVCGDLTLLGSAWLYERVGESKLSSDARKQAEEDFQGSIPWPPIVKKGNEYIIFDPTE